MVSVIGKDAEQLVAQNGTADRDTCLCQRIAQPHANRGSGTLRAGGNCRGSGKCITGGPGAIAVIEK